LHRLDTEFKNKYCYIRYARDETVVGIAAIVGGIEAVSAVGSAFLGRFSSSIVMPLSFVMPTTGGSPFFTTSY
jgi:hypothetical protein